MKVYELTDKVVFKGKEVGIKKKIHNFSNGNIKYLLDNGKTVTAEELSPVIKKDFHKSAEIPKEVVESDSKANSGTAKSNQVKEPVINQKSTEKNSKDSKDKS